jgi:hypothetical protein
MLQAARYVPRNTPEPRRYLGTQLHAGSPDRIGWRVTGIPDTTARCIDLNL